MEITWNKAIVGGFALCTAVAGATWNLRGDRIDELASKIDFYEKSGAHSLPDTLKSIGIANSEILANINSLSDYFETKKENRNLKELIESKDKHISDLTAAITKAEEELSFTENRHKENIEAISKKNGSKITELKNKILEMQSAIDTTVPRSQEFTLLEGASKELFASRIIVGVVNVNMNSVSVTMNNEETEMHAGEFKSVVLDDSDCKIILSEFKYIGNDPTRFNVVCQ